MDGNIDNRAERSALLSMMAITTVMRMQTVLILRAAIFACAHLDSLEMAPHAMVHWSMA